MVTQVTRSRFDPRHALTILWDVFKGLTVPLAALSAFLASLTALGVYEGEKSRQNLERLKHAYEVNRDYNNYTASRPSMTPCFEALTTISNADLVKALRYSDTKTFSYDPSKHTALTECLDKPPLNSGAWTVDQTRQVRAKVLREIDAMDTALISFHYAIGDRGVICENFQGYFQVDPVKAFFLKAIDAGVIMDSNYRNVKEFTQAVAGGHKCEPPLVVTAQDTRILEKYKAFLKWLSG